MSETVKRGTCKFCGARVRITYRDNDKTQYEHINPTCKEFIAELAKVVGPKVKIKIIGHTVRDNNTDELVSYVPEMGES